MKPNRSSKFTTGLVCTFAGAANRCFFFELDKEHKEHYQEVCDVFELESLDYMVHRTGGGGYHFISPTMISKESWKAIHEILKHINPKCPMTTLRMQPNKYANEDMFWYNTHAEENLADPINNNEQICTYLNMVFGLKFLGTASGEMKLVRYPLPLVDNL